MLPLATIIASVGSTFLANYFSSKNLDKQISAMYAERKLETDYKDKIEKVKNKELAINKLLKICSKNNLTTNCIKEIMDSNEKDIQEKYLETLDDINNLLTLLYVHFPSCVKYGEEINGICNNIWGNETTQFSDKNIGKPNIELKSDLLIPFYKNLSAKCYEVITELQKI